jgi:hypothetical protein
VNLSKKFVHHSSLLVGAEPLVPNDKVESRSSNGNQNNCHKDRDGLKRVAFIQQLKYIGFSIRKDI